MFKYFKNNFLPLKKSIFRVGISIALLAFGGNNLMAGNSTPCNGTPSAGTTQDTLGVCEMEPFVIQMNGTSIEDSITFQWQQRNPIGIGTWTDLIGFNSPTFNYPGGSFIQNMELRLIATCTNSGLSDTSKTISVVLKPANECYCEPTTSQPTYYILSSLTTSGADVNVSFAKLNDNYTGDVNDSYGDSTNSTKVIEAHATQSFDITLGFSNNLSFKNRSNKVWVDWNQDGSFDNSEILFSDYSKFDFSKTYPVTMPAGVAPGKYRLRVRYGDDVDTSLISPCGVLANGSTVDFSLKIVSSTICTTPTNLAVNNISDSTVDLVWQENGGATTWQIEYGTTGFTQGTGTLVTTTSQPHSLTINSNSNYDFYVRAICAIGDTSNWSLPFSFSNQYCTPNTSNNTAYISEINTIGAINDLHYVANSYPSNGFDNQTMTSLVAYPTQNITSDIHYFGYNSYNIDIWVDWNHDFQFSSSERIVDSYSNTLLHTLNFTIPSGTPVGNYRMRIRAKNYQGASMPCDNELYGSTVDVTLNVINEPTCLPVADILVDSLSDDAALITWTKMGSENSWKIEWGYSGFTPGLGNGIDSATVSNDTFLITALSNSTQYDVYIKALCGNNGFSYWTKGKFLTECSVLSALDFCDAFDTANDLGCWRIVDENKDGNTWHTYNLSGNGTIRIDNAAGTNNDYLISRKIHLTGNEVMSFSYKSNGSFFQSKLNILVSTKSSNITDFKDTLISHFTFNNDFFNDTTIDLSGYTGDVYIAFQIPQENITSKYTYLDNICFSICSPVHGIGSTFNICEADDTIINLNNKIISQYHNGYWFMEDVNVQNSLTDSLLDLTNLTSGTYHAGYVVPGSCTNDTTYVTVVVDQPSFAGIDSSIVGICKNQTFELNDVLSAGSHTGGHWLDYNQNTVNSSIVAPSLAGQYFYFYIVSNGACSPDSAIITLNVVDTCGGLSTSNMDLNQLSVYPNPTINQLNINNPSNVENLQAELFDINGRLIRVIHEKLSNTTSITIDELDSGVYTLRVYNKEEQKIFKIVKE